MSFDPTFPVTGGTTFGSLYAGLRANQSALAAHHAGASAPASPSTGWTWYDTTDEAMKIYDGVAWVNLGTLLADLAELVAARGSKSALADRLATSMNEDGSLKSGITAADPWYNPALTIAYGSSSTITVDGDQRDIFTVGRRCKLTQTGGPTYVTVESCYYAASSTVTFAEPTVAAAVSVVEPAVIDTGATGAAPREYDYLTMDGPLILKEQAAHPSALTSPSRWQLYAYQDGGTTDGVYVMAPNGDKTKITA